MRINAERMKNLRAEASWSQDELAIASDLTLRTVQRMENEGKASLQSVKAIAGALDILSDELELKLVNTYEYKTLEIPTKSGKKLSKQNFTETMQSLLNKEGSDGWQLKQVIIPNYEHPFTGGIRTDCVVAILERGLLGQL